MKESIEKIIKQIAEDEVTRNTVSWQAQEVILNPDIPVAQKDEVVDAAVETILKIGEGRKTYIAVIDTHNAKRDADNAKKRENRRLKRSHTIYKTK